MQRFPQELINVKVTDKHAVTGNDAVAKAIEAGSEKLGDSGRILVRPSGTRTTGSRDGWCAPTSEQAHEVAAPEIAEVIEKELGLQESSIF